jgi:hypothetical protein
MFRRSAMIRNDCRSSDDLLGHFSNNSDCREQNHSCEKKNDSSLFSIDVIYRGMTESNKPKGFSCVLGLMKTDWILTKLYWKCSRIPEITNLSMKFGAYRYLDGAS